jgi:hypothetical protein
MATMLVSVGQKKTASPARIKPNSMILAFVDTMPISTTSQSAVHRASPQLQPELAERILSLP